jgi:hypothetical protein
MVKRPKPRASGNLLEQLLIAEQQIDAAPGGRLGWIVAFAREDPAQWLPADREAHGYRLMAFGILHVGEPDLAASPANVVPVPTSEDVIALHAELKGKFRELVRVPAGQCVHFPVGDVRIMLIRRTAPGAKPAIFHAVMDGSWRTILWQKLFSMIAETDRLIACLTCGEPFLALRKMKFCTPKCAQRWWDREKIKAKQKGVGR